LAAAPAQVTVEVEGREVQVRAWRYDVIGGGGGVVPVYLLDTALPENAEQDRHLTDTLYGGDDRYRLAQEIVLGVGGVLLLRALHIEPAVYHMNEGHSALLTLALLGEMSPDDVRRRCMFTTHTPIPAGHDRFPLALATQVLGAGLARAFGGQAPPDKGSLDMTNLAIALSRFVNAVSL